MRLGMVQGLGALGVMIAVLGCGGGDDDGMGPPPPPPECVAGSGGTAVTVGDNFFNPASVSIAAGGMVTWTWTGALGHNVTFTVGPQPLPARSCTQASGTHQVTFTTTGTYEYTCTLHAMSGVVTVTP
jgi:plastocyanin